MTEATVDGITPAISELRRNSRIIVLLGSPEGLKGVSRKLSSLEGVSRIRRGLFIVQENSENHDAQILSYPFVSFTRTREIPTIREKMNADSNRVYALVSFSYNNPTAQQKKYVERLFRKTTGIRLRPGVILFPLLRSKERRRIIGSKDESLLIDSTEFTRLVRINGGTALRWSRLRVINLDGVSYIKKAIQNTLSRDLVQLEKKTRTLRKSLKDSNVAIAQLKRNYTLLSRSFRELRTKWMLAKKLWLYDSEKALKRTYNMLINTRRVISFAEARESSS
jgi:hypothetical protein